MPRVTLIQRVLPHYRISFVERLHQALASSGVELRLVFGDELAGVGPRTEPFDAHWATKIVNRYWRVGSIDVVWQPCLSLARGSELVIVEQSNRLLANYLFQASRSWSSARVAFWGHGRNLQSRRPNGARERWKSVCARYVDWWFAYTELSRSYVAASGFPSERITVVNNAIDDEALRIALKRLENCDRRELRRSLGCRGDTVALFCGSLHAEKRLEFLIAAADLVRASVPEFELLIVGDGPMRALIEEACRTRPWVRYAGRVLGDNLARYFRASEVVLMPGLVGLVIADSFVAGLPIITTDFQHHSPEIAYLQHGVNGFMTDNNVHAYARAVVEYFERDSLRSELGAAARLSAERYTLNRMVENFSAGVWQCLA